MRKKRPAGPVTLAPDFHYSVPYELEHGEPERATYPPERHPFVHAYNDVAERRKNRFLKDAANLLRAVGRELERYGFRPAAVTLNPAGIAVSGAAWADYHHPDHPRWIHLDVSETGVDILGPAPPVGSQPTSLAFTTRRDRICVMGRWHEGPSERRGERESWRSIKMGTNVWFDANLNHLDLATSALKLLDIKPLPAAEPFQTSLFDLPPAAPGAGDAIARLEALLNNTAQGGRETRPA